MIWSDWPGVKARFDAKVDKSGDCHIWQGSRAGGKKSRYGTFRLSRPIRRSEYAHRLALIHKIGRDLAPGEESTHSCDTTLCVNEEHLRVGSRRSNMGEAVTRGRISHGERHTSKLKEQEVREIMALLAVGGLRHEDIAIRYGVCRAVVTNIKNGKTWKHITLSEVR